MLSPTRVLRQRASQGRGLTAALTAKQQEVERDRHHLRVVWGGRQWGKSTWQCNAHARSALPEPGVVNLILASSVHKARDLTFPTFERLNVEHDAGLELLRGDAIVRTRAGGMIHLLGLNTLSEAEKIRGYVVGSATIEESGTLRDELLEYTINSCLRPAQMRYWRRGGRGTTALGTPSRNMQTYWHKMCLGETGGSVHFATVRDNPYIPDADAYLRQVLEDNRKLGWTEETPEYRREYLGQFCADVSELPLGRWNGQVIPQRLAPEDGFTVLTLDFGQVHPNAWVVHRVTTETAIDDERQRIVRMHKVHLLHASQENRMQTDQVAARTRSIAERFHANVIRGDSGGGGAQSIADLQSIYSLPIEPVKKRRDGKRKADAIYLYDSLLGSDTIQVYEDTAPWQRQARVTPWNETRTDFHESYKDVHALDAGLYSLEDLTAHMSEDKAEPLPGTPEWERKRTEERWRERVEYWQGQG